MSVDVHLGDCRDVVKTLDPVDAVVTDPPYGLSFMGKGWDHGVPGVEFWTAISGAMKPGAHLLAFGGTRTYHRLTCAIEDAGFEIRDCIMWLYGSGFPKSLDVSKAIDKAAGDERDKKRIDASKVRNPKSINGGHGVEGGDRPWMRTAIENGFHEVAGDIPATEAAKQWQGWGTALKPSYEPIIVARKPLDGTVAANILEHGTGALNVDGCRVESEKPTGWGGKAGGATWNESTCGLRNEGDPRPVNGRWPANVIHDGSEEATAGMGDAARYFYTPKASGTDRGNKPEFDMPLFGETVEEFRNTHPTVKPVDLMRYLCRLVTPPGGTVLDPFCGSGTTIVAAKQEGFNAIGIELNEEYFDIINQRISVA